MPDQVPTTLSTPIFASYYRRVSSGVLNGLHFSTGNSTVSFPSNLSAGLNMPASTVFDIQAVTVSGGNSSSDVVNITVLAAGSFNTYAFEQAGSAAEVAVQGLAAPIVFSVAMRSYQENQTYECVYLTGEGGEWSSSGLNLTSVSSTSATCNTTHLSSFQVRPQSSAPHSTPLSPQPTQSPSVHCHTSFAPIGIVSSISLFGLLLAAILRLIRPTIHVVDSDKITPGLPEAWEEPPFSNPSLHHFGIESEPTKRGKYECSLRKFVLKHGVFGLFIREEMYNSWVKMLKFTTVLAAEMCIIGAFYDESESEGSKEAGEIWSSYSVNDFTYVVIALACGLVLSLILLLLFLLCDYFQDRMRGLAYCLVTAFCVFLTGGALAGTIVQSLEVCSEASGHWAISLLPVLGGETLVVQSLVAVLRSIGRSTN
jgi:hypothetical protein